MSSFYFFNGKIWIIFLITWHICELKSFINPAYDRSNVKIWSMYDKDCEHTIMFLLAVDDWISSCFFILGALSRCNVHCALCMVQCSLNIVHTAYCIHYVPSITFWNLLIQSFEFFSFFHPRRTQVSRYNRSFFCFGYRYRYI